MSRRLQSVRSWTSRVRTTFRSVLSWMLWLLTTPRRVARERQDRRRAAEEARLHQQEALLRAALLEALTPLSTALRRQDQLLMQETAFIRQHLLEFRDHQESLLLDILNSLQPSARQQLMGSILAQSPRRSAG